MVTSPIFGFMLGTFTNIVARWPRSTHNSFIFRDSKIGQRLNDQHQSLEDGFTVRWQWLPLQAVTDDPLTESSHWQAARSQQCPQKNKSGHAKAHDQPNLVCFHGPENGKVIRDHICNTFFWQFWYFCLMKSGSLLI